MALESDVLVIGGGIAGSMAARVAADRGAEVRLVSGSASSLRQASGLIDVLGYWNGHGPLIDPFDTLPRSGNHPYAKVEEETVRESLAYFDEIVGSTYNGGHTDKNGLVITATGHLKPTSRYPRSVTPGLVSDERDCLLIGFDAHTGFDAPLAASRLDDIGVPFTVRGETVEFPMDVRADAGSIRYARILDRDESGVRARLAATIDAAQEDEGRIGLPAILGIENTTEIRDDLEDHLNVPVFEVPTGPPSVLGYRLERLLDDALSAAGVSVTTGERVVGADTSRDTIHRVFVDPDREIPYVASQYILATGGLVGEGVESDRKQVREPVFDCPISYPADRDEWYEDEAFGDHPFARFGVRIDSRCHPVDSSDDPTFENLRAAGAVIGGANAAAEMSGAGISIATGYQAGSIAGEIA